MPNGGTDRQNGRKRVRSSRAHLPRICAGNARAQGADSQGSARPRRDSRHDRRRGKRRARPQGRRHRLRHGQGRHAGGAERRRHDSDRRQFRNYSQGSRRGARDIRQHPPRDTLSARLQYRRDTLRLCGDALRNARAASADTAPLYKSRHRLAPRPRARRGDARQPRYAASPRATAPRAFSPTARDST